MSRRISGWILLGVAVALACALVACGDGNSTPVSARARYFNALIGVTGDRVDFLSPRGASTTVQANNVVFGTVTPSLGTLLLPIESGSETFDVSASGTTTPKLATLTATVAVETSYFIATSGVVGQ